MNTKDRITELKEKRDEFILNESVFEDENPSWGEVVDAQAEAEAIWNLSNDGKELKALLDDQKACAAWDKELTNIELEDADLIDD